MNVSTEKDKTTDFVIQPARKGLKRTEKRQIFHLSNNFCIALNVLLLNLKVVSNFLYSDF